MLEVGRNPESLRVLLSAGRPFTTSLAIKAGSDEYFTEVPTLVFDFKSPATDVVWTSLLSVDAKSVTFDATAEEVDLVLAGIPSSRKVTLTYGDMDWAIGKVEIVND